MTDARISPEELFWRSVDKSGECWIWTGTIHHEGYGMCTKRLHGISTIAHRYAYLTEVGAIPMGMTIDHLCHTNDPLCPGGPSCPHRRCVNPSHLEIVTPEENSRRGRKRFFVAHCPQGHPYDEANTHIWGGRRYCRACNAARSTPAAKRARQPRHA